MSEEIQKPIVGITMGDFNGIGPEVLMKALAGMHMNKICTPVVYGSTKVISRYKQLLELNDWQYQSISKPDQANEKQINLINCVPDTHEVEPGKIKDDAGKAALSSLQRAAKDLKEGRIHALVTAPINKHNIQSEEFKFPGHTEFLSAQFDNQEVLMFMVSERLKIGVVTGHVPIVRVKENLSKDKIVKKLNAMLHSLKEDFGVQRPRVAVLGLNPHAGENGLIGKEEQEIIIPAINEVKGKGHFVFGPFSADGFFGTAQQQQFDAVLGMYHDQGLMPFKMLAFEEGVNFTAGLPVVRTSPDHGTAYDIAGKNVADPSSMINAIFTAVDIYK
ncbi:MAG: 4-hydroxythreonine-4-phosphate dehydrogenase PdxA [Rhodoferax sp.]|nr:4-hydroxythreonine-4-phosphate dehydrogenase PdxA [Rhodoferax sp.]